MKKILTVIGLMSGTSLDGIDAAIIKTDGEEIIEFGEFLTLPYENEFRNKLRKLLVDHTNIWSIENELTYLHGKAVELLLEKASLTYKDIDLIGFHGQTIFHKPEQGLTKQIGIGALLSEITKINVICDFRSKDVACGGEGAPLVPIYHKILCKDLEKPLAIVNIGGVANITWLGENNQILAFDTGPGCALIDDYCDKNLLLPFDKNGEIARESSVDQEVVDRFLSLEFFNKKPPKSLDRNNFSNIDLKSNVKDNIATLTALTIHSIVAADKYLSSKPKAWLIAGGGRKNTFIIESLNALLDNQVRLIDEIANGDAIEAQAFALLAARSYYKMDISFPETTGVCRPVTGGAFYQA